VKKEPHDGSDDGDGDDNESSTAATASAGAKAKKVKKVRDPNQPKRPQNAFFLFTQQNRERLKSENPDLAGQDLVKQLGAECVFSRHQHQHSITVGVQSEQPWGVAILHLISVFVGVR
jgi:hypothetical protein